MSAEMDIDEADTETIQAQIDLSLSFAQDLVSSWIKPSVKLALPKRNDTEKELEEYMRRPPRLGVGAPIPESKGPSRDSAYLKARLIEKKGKKHARDYDDDVQKPVADDEESRATAIQKKAKVDAFGETNHKKKKRKANEANGLLTPFTSLTSAYDATAKETTGKIETNITEDDSVEKLPPQNGESGSIPSQPPSTPKRKKKRKKHTDPQALPTPNPSVENTQVHRNPTPHRAASITAGNSVTNTPSASTKRTLPELLSPKKFEKSIPSTPKSPSYPKSPQSHMSSVLKFPVLNLNGPPQEIDVDDNQVNCQSPKKKRKRRKKRKKSMAADGDP